jgi:hypothetical protein
MLLLAGVFFITLILHEPLLSSDLYGYDEADYMNASRRGLGANYMDRGALPLSTFLRMGTGKGFEKSERGSLSEYIRDSGDITFYRHYHGPLYFYGQTLLHSLFGDHERAVRAGNLIYFVLAALLAYLTCVRLGGKYGRAGGLVAATLLLISRGWFVTSTQVTPHALYVPTFLLTLYFSARLARDGRVRYGTWAAIALALSFLTIEYAALLLVTCALLPLLYRRRIFGWTRRAMIITWIAAWVFVLALVILVIWPAGWLKLTLLKNYLFFGYYALVRGGEYGDAGFLQVWGQRFAANPIGYSAALAGLCVAAWRVRRRSAYAPYLIYAGLIFLTTFRNNSPSPTYIASLLAAAFVLTGLAFADCANRVSPERRQALGATVVLVFCAAIVLALPQRPSVPPEQPRRAVFAYIEKRPTRLDAQLLMDRRLLPTLEYYHPDRTISTFSESAEDFHIISARAASEGYTEIIYAGDAWMALADRLAQDFHVTIMPFTMDGSIHRLTLSSLEKVQND